MWRKTTYWYNAGTMEQDKMLYGDNYFVFKRHIKLNYTVDVNNHRVMEYFNYE